MIKSILILILSTTSLSLIAQEERNSHLYKTIMSKDSLLFDVGFNTCDISQFEVLMSEDLEFYHDKSGTSNKQEFLSNLRNGLCSRPNTYQSRRELVKKSVEIYPLYKNSKLYGAIQTATHRFYEKVAGEKERFASSAKFTHLWLLENGAWKLTRSLSYAHDTKLKE